MKVPGAQVPQEVRELPEGARGLKRVERGRIVMMGWSASGISFPAHGRLTLVIGE
jgi:hypothetical protein